MEMNPGEYPDSGMIRPTTGKPSYQTVALGPDQAVIAVARMNLLEQSREALVDLIGVIGEEVARPMLQRRGLNVGDATPKVEGDLGFDPVIGDLQAVARVRKRLQEVLDATEPGHFPLVNAKNVLDLLNPKGLWSTSFVAVERSVAEVPEYQRAADRDGVHLLKLGETTWNLRHPLVCRDGDLFECALHKVTDKTGVMNDDGERGVFRVGIVDGELALGEKVAEVT